MFNIKSIAKFATDAITKYKAQRVRDVVSQYCATVDTQVMATMPVAIEFYRGVATAIVDKTFENPEPALKLIEALDAVTKHYGPALRAEFDTLSTKLEVLGASPVKPEHIRPATAAAMIPEKVP